MTRLALIAFLLLAFAGQAQTHYTFSVENVASYPEAKPVISIIRKAFNSETPRLFFPVFQADQHVFVADSDMSLTEQKLRDLLASEGYTLSSFKVEESIHAETEEQ